MNLKKNTRFKGFFSRKDVPVALDFVFLPFPASHQSNKNFLSEESRTRRRFSVTESARGDLVLIPSFFILEPRKSGLHEAEQGFKSRHLFSDNGLSILKIIHPRGET